MRNSPRWIALAVFLLLASQAPAGGRDLRESNAELILISFGGTAGELKDCGCLSNPMGGLSHRASLIDSLRIRRKPLLLVDLGDFMSTESVVAGLKNPFIWRKMEEMGYCVTTPGAREISDWRGYQDLLRGSSIRSVATNLTVTEDGRDHPAGLPYRIEEVNDVRVAFFSLIGTRELSTAAPPAGLQFHAQDPLAAASAIVPALRGKADLVVLMSQMAADQTTELLAKVPGIDVALYGREPQWVDAARMSSKTIVQQTGVRGSQFGELVLIVGPSGGIVEWGSRNDALGPAYGEDLEVSAQVEQVEKQAKEMVTLDQQGKAAKPGSPAAVPAPQPDSPAVPAQPSR